MSTYLSRRTLKIVEEDNTRNVVQKVQGLSDETLNDVLNKLLMDYEKKGCGRRMHAFSLDSQLSH